MLSEDRLDSELLLSLDFDSLKDELLKDELLFEELLTEL
jgi:hypothetical protein